jgi:hypothetical protein
MKSSSIDFKINSSIFIAPKETPKKEAPAPQKIKSPEPKNAEVS